MPEGTKKKTVSNIEHSSKGGTRALLQKRSTTSYWCRGISAGLVRQGPQSGSALCSTGVADLGDLTHGKPHLHMTQIHIWTPTLAVQQKENGTVAFLKILLLFRKQAELKMQISSQASEASNVSHCGKFTVPVVKFLVSRLMSEARLPVSPSAREPLSCRLEVTHSRLSPACCAD